MDNMLIIIVLFVFTVLGAVIGRVFVNAISDGDVLGTITGVILVALLGLGVGAMVSLRR